MITTYRQRLEAMVGPERISTTSVTWLASGLPRNLGHEREQLGLLLGAAAAGHRTMPAPTLSRRAGSRRSPCGAISG
jgi:hypothetical protein